MSDNVKHFPDLDPSDLNATVKALQATEAAANAHYLQTKAKVWQAGVVLAYLWSLGVLIFAIVGAAT